MRRIECIFGKRFGSGERRLRLLTKTSGGCYFQDGTDIFMLCDAAFGEIDFAVSCPCVREIVCDPSFRMRCVRREGACLPTALSGGARKTR